MPLRKLLLRVLLWSLGLAAFFGAAGILLAEFEAIWRIAGTAIWTGFCAGAMLLCSILVDRPKARLAGLFGMVATVIEYLLVLPLLWIPWSWAAGGFNWRELFFLQVWFLPLCAIPAMIMLRMTRTPSTRIAGWTGVGWCAAGFVLLLIGSIAEAGARTSAWRNHGFEVALVLAATGPLAILALVGAGMDRRHWRWIGVAAAAVAIIAAAYSILERIYHGEELLAILISVAAVVAHTNIMLQVPLPGRQRWLAVGSAAAGGVTGAVVAGMAAGMALLQWTDGDAPGLMRIGSASAVLAGCGTLAVLVLARINRRIKAPTPSTLDLRELTVTCPVCRKKQSLAAGEARCGGCGLIIRIGLEEPRCVVCEYSLLMFKGDRCPECGAPVSTPAPVVDADRAHRLRATASPGGEAVLERRHGFPFG